MSEYIYERSAGRQHRKEEIADELGVSERTCRNEHGRCSTCAAIMYDAPNYCPKCGARVVE